MIVVRFKVICQPDRREDALKAFEQVVAPSRTVEGVVHFDIGRDLTDANAIIATEVFENREALDRQESLPEVAQVMALFPEIIQGEPEATIYEVSSAEPYGE
jgi:quinol monooxygenase YgiN